MISIIKSEKIHSQDELNKKLKLEGIEVTQATLSRDLRHLGIIRSFEPKYGYVYTISNSKLEDYSQRTSEDLIREIREIQFSGNLAVIKTKLGYATGIAYEIDRLKISGVLGTVGGDDTIIAVLKEDADRESFLKVLKGERANDVFISQDLFTY